MAHFTPASQPSDTETAAQAAQNARFGRVLFAVYLAFYGAFVLLVAFAADLMQTEIAGVNVAILYGLALIAAALVLAIVYLALCKRAPPTSL